MKEEYPGWLFSKVIRLVHKTEREFFHSINLHRGQPKVLHFINKNAGCTQKELHEMIGIQAPTLTNILKALEEKNYINKEKDAVDQRKTRVYLTEHGKNMIGKINKRHQQSYEQSMKGFSETEREQFHQYLLRIEQNLMNSEDRRSGESRFCEAKLLKMNPED